jgi:hypothetical protein
MDPSVNLRSNLGGEELKPKEGEVVELSDNFMLSFSFLEQLNGGGREI